MLVTEEMPVLPISYCFSRMNWEKKTDNHLTTTSFQVDVETNNVSPINLKKKYLKKNV